MNYYTADLHLFHKNIISYQNRPFADCEEMHAKVSANDDVYILGDLSFAKSKETAGLLRRLAGKKYLIKGNHDGVAESKNVRQELEWVKDYHTLEDKRGDLIMANYNLYDDTMSLTGISISGDGVIFSTKYGNIATIQPNGQIHSYLAGIIGIIEKDGSIYTFEEGRVTRVPFGTLLKNGEIRDTKYHFLGTLGQDFADEFFNNETAANNDANQNDFFDDEFDDE